MCRRKQLLNFLGEEFDPAKCNKMCDNCQREYKIEMKDYITEVRKIIKVIKDVEEYEQSISLNKLLELVTSSDNCT